MDCADHEITLSSLFPERCPNMIAEKNKKRYLDQPQPKSCPRCKGTDFREIDCGMADDIFWNSYVCRSCGLYYSGWSRQWFVGGKDSLDDDHAEVYNGGKRTAGKL
jgi:hypothetical protein